MTGVGYFNHFPEVAALFPRVLTEIETTSAEALLATAKDKAPVATGALRDSGHLAPAPTGGVDVVFDPVNASGEGYAHFVEFGTHDMTGHPFLLPATLEAEDPFMTQLETIEARLPR